MANAGSNVSKVGRAGWRSGGKHLAMRIYRSCCSTRNIPPFRLTGVPPEVRHVPRLAVGRNGGKSFPSRTPPPSLDFTGQAWPDTRCSVSTTATPRRREVNRTAIPPYRRAAPRNLHHSRFICLLVALPEALKLLPATASGHISIGSQRLLPVP